MMNILHKFIHIWDTYDKVSDIFVKPKVHFYFGRWSKFYGLPVWRRGPIIQLGHSYFHENRPGKNHYEPVDEFVIDDGNWYAAWAKHTHWNPEFLKTCSWWGRLWRKFIKPTYQLPIWLSFYHSNYDIIWKTKYEDCRFEFSGQFCIVAFGICFAMWTKAPHASTDFHGYPNDDAYWETILEWIHREDKNMSFEEFLSTESSLYGSTYYNRKNMLKKESLYNQMKLYDHNSPEHDECWNKVKKIPKMEYRYLACRPEYIKPKYKEQYNNAVKKIKESKAFENYYFIYD